MAANDAFINMKVPELRKFLKERDIQISVNGKSRKRAELLELCKNAAEIKVPKLEKETVQRAEFINSKITLSGGKLLPHPFSLKFWTHNFTGIPDFRFPDIYHHLVGKDGYDEDRLRHGEDLKYHDSIDDGIRQAKVGNPVKNFTDSSFFSTSFMNSFRFNAGLLLSSFRIVLLSALNIDKFFYHIVHLLEVNVCLARNSHIVLFFESFFSMNFVFLKGVVVVFQSNISRNTETFCGKYFFDVFASVSFSPLTRPFFALTWTSTDYMLISYCWSELFNSRKCLHDLFSLEVFGAYMQVLDGRELLINDKRHSIYFLVSLRLETRKSWIRFFFKSYFCTQRWHKTPNLTNSHFNLAFKISAYSPQPRLGADN